MPSFSDGAKQDLSKRSKSLEIQAKQLKAYGDSIVSGILPVFPSLSSGGRTFVTVAGKPVAVCLGFSCSVVMDYDEVRSIDSQLPWDIMTNQIRITGKLSKFIDPEDSLDAGGLFSTIQSNLHQPFVEILVQDANGTSQFFAKGMFVSFDANFAVGQLSVTSATFVGVLYQNNTYQKFVPYPSDPASDALKAMKAFQKRMSNQFGGL